MKWHYCYFNANPQVRVAGSSSISQPAIGRQQPGNEETRNERGDLLPAIVELRVFHTYAYKGLAEITYTPRAPPGPPKDAKKTFSSHEMREKYELEKRKVENKQQRQPKVKISTVLKPSGKRKSAKNERNERKKIRKRYQVFIYMTFVCHSTSGRCPMPTSAPEGYC